MPSIDRLTALAQLWAAANDRSLSRLATIVANDGKLFERISGGGGCTVATFDRFIAFFLKPESWPAGVPSEALELIEWSEAA